MTSAPDVSVVVPTWNRADRLARLLPHLEALAADGRVEVVVVDDGSTDGTRSLLADQAWATVVTQANRGAAGARNAGWRRAAAPVVAFLDDDCTPGPGWPLGLLPVLDDATVVGIGSRIDGRGDGPLDVYVEVERMVDHGRDLDDGLDYVVTANAVFRTAALEAVGGFDESFPGAAGEDVDLSWRLRRTGGRLVRGDVPVVHDHRTTPREILRTYRGHGRARARLDARHPDRGARGAAVSALAPATWIDRWQRYRSGGVGVVGATGLLVLRAAGLGAYAWGLRQGRRALRSPG